MQGGEKRRSEQPPRINVQFDRNDPTAMIVYEYLSHLRYGEKAKTIVNAFYALASAAKERSEKARRVAEEPNMEDIVRNAVECAIEHNIPAIAKAICSRMKDDGIVAQATSASEPALIKKIDVPKSNLINTNSAETLEKVTTDDVRTVMDWMSAF
ncbi:MAG: hypothetical protein RR415_00310 [Ruthenibacterium sp.]